MLRFLKRTDFQFFSLPSPISPDSPGANKSLTDFLLDEVHLFHYDNT